MKWFNRELNMIGFENNLRTGSQCGYRENFENRSVDDPFSIVGGENITGAKDWMVSIQKNGKHFCGGMLVAPNWVLSASHCTSPLYSLSGITANVGGVNLNNRGDLKNSK